jgi:AhpD family alkylhydroperoxidase
MTPRMKNPAMLLPDAMKGIQHLVKATGQGGVPATTIELIGMRASQINGCAACIQGHLLNAKKAGETDERLAAIVAWRESPFFTDSERAALALTESVTRIADRSGEAVPEEVWNEAAGHFDEPQLAAIVLTVGLVNLFNRVNVAVKEPADHPSWA